ncbi:MAG: CHAP domain-containing protein, partial [Ruminococcus sp.]
MKRKLRRIIFGYISLVLTATMLMSTTVIPASALSYSGSASYKSGKYYTALTKVTLTGNQRTDIVNVAKSQIGYQEGSSSSQLSGEVKGSANYTEYGRWYGLQDMWCAMFVSWCANVAGVSTSIVPKHSYTPTGLSWFKNKGQAYSRATVASGGYKPQAGDIIYFKSARNSNPTNHIGIVTGYSGSTIYTIEGNTSSATISTNGGAVAAKSYSISNTYIVYVCKPAYKNTSTVETTSAVTTEGCYPACDSSYTTLISALESIGVDSSFSFRTTIAAANGITDYTGTAEQNTQMLNLLKAGQLVNPTYTPTTTSNKYYPACDSTYTTLTSALDSIGVDSSYSFRSTIAAANGITDYSGTAEQNTQMLNLLKAGTLINPSYTEASETTSATTTTEATAVTETTVTEPAESTVATEAPSSSAVTYFPACD